VCTGIFHSVIQYGCNLIECDFKGCIDAEQRNLHLYIGMTEMYRFRSYEQHFLLLNKILFIAVSEIFMHQYTSILIDWFYIFYMPIQPSKIFFFPIRPYICERSNKMYMYVSKKIIAYFFLHFVYERYKVM
jgi:hypothetical protein